MHAVDNCMRVNNVGGISYLDNEQKNVIINLPLTELEPFSNHPFAFNELTPVVPDTGDHGNMWIWGLGVAVCCGFLVSIIVIEKRKRKEK